MYENFAHGSLPVDFDQIVTQAIRDGRDVRLDRGEDSGFIVVIDGVALPNERVGFPTESFGWPLDDCPIDDGEPTEVVDKLAEKIERRRTEARNSIPNTTDHSAAEGVTASIEESDT